MLGRPTTPPTWDEAIAEQNAQRNRDLREASQDVRTALLSYDMSYGWHDTL